MNSLLVIILYHILIGSFTFAEKKAFKLELVQALFRHGDRIPDKEEIYKTDPYDPEFYRSIGYGQLTNIGMQRAFRIGQLLRERYDTFLGKYNPDHVYAYSTNYDRTKTSLQLVLAGLFQPRFIENSTWSKISNSNPTAIHRDYDFFLEPSDFAYCSKFRRLLKEVENLPEVKDCLNKYTDFLNYLRASTGIGRTHVFTIILVASNLQAVQSMGLELPFWISKEQYKKLKEIFALFWDVMSLTPELRTITVGPMVKQFLENMKNQEKVDKRKIYLYSVHDMNIALFTRAHNFTKIPANPAYGSTVIIEKLRGSDDQSYIRMLLWTGVGEKLIELKLENCDYECPLVEYEKIVKTLLPHSGVGTCYRRISLDGIKSRKRIKIKPVLRMLYPLFEADIFTLKYGNEFYIDEDI